MKFFQRLLQKRPGHPAKPSESQKPQKAASLHLSHTEFKLLLDQEISPIMRKKGFRYDGRYTWYGDMENHMRKSVSVFLLKGPAIFRWSVTFDFIPLPSGNRLTYSRTEKSIVAHMYEYPKDWVHSFLGKAEPEAWWYSPCKMTLSGKDQADIIRQIHRAYACELERFEHWHSQIHTLEDALRMVSEKIGPDGAPLYPFLVPSPVYVKAFLQAATGEAQEGRALLETYFLQSRWSDELQQKALQKLDALGSVL